MLPPALRPASPEPVRLPDGTVIRIPKASLTLPRWRGAPLTQNFGNKPLVDLDGEPVFAELAVVRLLTDAGWQARWVETYGTGLMPKLLTT